MQKLLTSRLRFRLLIALFLGGIGIAVILYMSSAVVRDLRLLNSARSDNVQWTLSQAEVEFLEYQRHLDVIATQTDPDLKTLRQEFDIFYSRLTTLNQASIYRPLRELPDFARNLSIVQAFLAASVTSIDASDEDLTAALPQLAVQAREVRPDVRGLANSGLNYFAEDSDRRRNKVSVTLTQMAAVTIVLIVTLLLLSLYLAYLNAQNVRRRAEVVQAGERMNIVTGTALDAVIVSDAYGRILDFNAAAEQIFGHFAEDVIGGDLGALIIPDHHRAAHSAGMERLRANGERRVVGKGRVKLEAKRANGDVFPVELSIQSAMIDEGEIFIAFLRDISHRVRSETELVEARDRALAGEKSKTDFLATMSHEIRTPLNGLLGNLALLQDTRLSAQQARYIKNMDTSGKLLMSHISDVLDITKYDAGKLRLRPVAMNTGTLLQDIIDNQSGAAAAHDTTLTWGWVGPPTDWIRADRDRIQHILMNIIGNAVKFTHDGRISVELQTQEDDDRLLLQITVRDTGIGMNAELQAQIFDDFMTGDSSYGREVGGTGLGLGIAKRFVQALSGSIDVESSPNNGSIFRIRLPVDRIDAPEIAPPLQPVKAPIGQRRILLVEDNEINRVVAREMLAGSGHNVTEASNGHIAVGLAQAEAFDLILMDISMPVMDGREAARTIRAGAGASANAPIVALTANAMPEEQEAFLSDGMNDILTKPLTRAGLIRIIAKFGVAPGAAAARPPEKPAAKANAHLDDLHETLGPDVLASLIARFLAEVDAALSDLRPASDIPLGDISDRTHRVAGSAASLGAAEIRAALIAVEQAAKAADATQVDKALAALPVVWASERALLLAELRRLQQGGPET